MTERTCGECIHAKVCERAHILTEFSRDNAAYCKLFEEHAGVDKWVAERVMSASALMKDEWEKRYERFKAFESGSLVVVVRCKDCVHMKERFGARYCEVWTMFNGAGDYGYCNYGERREEHDS